MRILLCASKVKVFEPEIITLNLKFFNILCSYERALSHMQTWVEHIHEQVNDVEFKGKKIKPTIPYEL